MGHIRRLCSSEQLFLTARASSYSCSFVQFVVTKTPGFLFQKAGRRGNRNSPQPNAPSQHANPQLLVKVQKVRSFSALRIGMGVRFFHANTPVPRKRGPFLQEIVLLPRVGAPFLPCKHPCTEEKGSRSARKCPQYPGWHSVSSMHAPLYRGKGVSFCKKMSPIPGLALRFFHARDPVPRKWGAFMRETDPKSTGSAYVFASQFPPLRGG